MRAAVAWALLVPVGTVLVLAALLAGLPAMALGLAGAGCWHLADRLLRRRLLAGGEVGDDTLAMLAGHDDELWRSYLTHPTVRVPAARKVRGR